MVDGPPTLNKHNQNMSDKVYSWRGMWLGGCFDSLGGQWGGEGGRLMMEFRKQQEERPTEDMTCTLAYTTSQMYKLL